MHGIGNEQDALTILQWVRGHGEEYSVPKCVTLGLAPKGWEFLGHGSFRSVWKSPEGVAYKVGHYEGDRQTREEVWRLGEAWEEGAPEGCRIPRFNAFFPEDETVIAVEAINGVQLYHYRGPDRDDLYDLLHSCENWFGLEDLHDENAMVDEDGLLVPVDFGG